MTAKKGRKNNLNGAAPSDNGEEQRLAIRLREAREYAGLLQEDVAAALSIPRASVSAIEAGKRRVSGLELRRMARLYHRPVGWLLGDDESSANLPQALFHATAELSDGDKEQLVKFAQFLAAAGAPNSRRSKPPAKPRQDRSNK